MVIKKLPIIIVFVLSRFLTANILFSGEVSFWSGVELALN
jgi:hypothetical protein